MEKSIMDKDRIICEQVNTFRETIKCLNCEDGYMYKTGKAYLTTGKTLYDHRCNKCKVTEEFLNMYPREFTKCV